MTTGATVLAFDTATEATIVGLSVGGVLVCERADRPSADERPRHAERLLTLCEEVLEQSGVGWSDLTRIGVGVGPGTFTGLRIGVATARGLAQGLGVELVPVSTLEVLALQVRSNSPEVRSAAVSDARRGEAFIAVWGADGSPEVAPAACRPGDLVEALFADGRPTLAAGAGALIFRAELEAGGIEVPADSSELHQVGGAALCQLAATGDPIGQEGLLPDYVREPDAEIALQSRSENQ